MCSHKIDSDLLSSLYFFSFEFKQKWNKEFGSFLWYFHKYNKTHREKEKNGRQHLNIKSTKSRLPLFVLFVYRFDKFSDKRKRTLQEIKLPIVLFSHFKCRCKFFLLWCAYENLRITYFLLTLNVTFQGILHFADILHFTFHMLYNKVWIMDYTKSMIDLQKLC